MAQRVKIARPDPHAPPELVTRSRRDFLPGDCLGVVDDAIAGGAHVHGDEEVVDDAIGRDRHEERASNGEQGAVGADQHVQAALEKLEQRFESPVELFAGWPAPRDRSRSSPHTQPISGRLKCRTRA